MVNKGAIAFTFIILTAGLSVGVSLARVDPPARPLTQEQVRQSLGFINNLITSSSVVRHIEHTKFPPAIAYLEEARRLHSQALASLDSGDLSTAAKLRDETIRLTLEAGHLSQIADDNSDKQKSDYASKLRSVNALMEAYRNIAAKEGMEKSASSLQEKVDSLLQQADNFRHHNDYPSAIHTLNQAYAQLKVSIERVRGGTTLGKLSEASAPVDSSLSRYETKMRSLNALIDAHQRIAKEKDEAGGAHNLLGIINPLLEQARNHASHGDYDQALAAVNSAYSLVTASIEKLRGGETLVRNLKFETKEEEYHYELDRNDTYQMLITRLIEDNKSIEVTPRVKKFMDKAKSLRNDAVDVAQAGEFDKAIKLLEGSTQNLIFAMRNAGFFVPG